MKGEPGSGNLLQRSGSLNLPCLLPNIPTFVPQRNLGYICEWALIKDHRLTVQIHLSRPTASQAGTRWWTVGLMLGCWTFGLLQAGA